MHAHATTLGVWTTAKLCMPRKKLAATTVGNLAIFGGGYLSGGGGSRPEWDMFNASSGEWSHGNLSLGRMRLQAAAVGNRAFFVSGACACARAMDACAGVIPHGAVVALSRPTQPRARGVPRNVHAAGMGDTCGAQCPMVDVYDASTNSWSVTNLKRGRYEFAAVGFASKMLVTGRLALAGRMPTTVAMARRHCGMGHGRVPRATRACVVSV